MLWGEIRYVNARPHCSFTCQDVGASIEAYLRPLEALRRVTVFDLDETKCVPVLFSVGYRCLPAPANLP